MNTLGLPAPQNFLRRVAQFTKATRRQSLALAAALFVVLAANTAAQASSVIDDDLAAAQTKVGDKKNVEKKSAPEEKATSPLLKIGCTENGKRVVKSIAVEEYLRGVVPKEMPPEALKAQAVAARTFALKNRNRHAAEGYDLCDTTHCQFYVPQSEATTTDKAIADTAGEVLLFGGEMIDAVFHTDSGGMTEDSENVWGTALPYLRAVKEYTTGTKAWTKKITPPDFAKAVGLKKPETIKISPLVVGKRDVDRSASGRVKSVTIIGDGTKKVIGGTNFRSLFNLPSTLFGITIDGKNIVISGFGAGHGLGMSQHGANNLAEKGANYRTILHHYYRNVTITKVY